MSKATVTLINPNNVRPFIAPYALDVLTTSLEEEGYNVEILDLVFEDDWKTALKMYFSDKNPLLVGITIRNTDTVHAQEQRVFIHEHKEIIDEIKNQTKAPIIAGGVGFSTMPFALMDYFDIPYGVKGPGEIIICQAANKLLSKESLISIPGLIINDGKSIKQTFINTCKDNRDSLINRNTPYRRKSLEALKVDNLKYYNLGGLGSFLSINGCSYACSHCVEPDSKGSTLLLRNVTAVVDEIESLVLQGVYDLHTADSEFNICLDNSKAILKEIINRKHNDIHSPLHRLGLWIYVQPAPFDEEFVGLLAQAGCKGINLSLDHVRDEMLNSWKVDKNGNRYYTFEAAGNVCEWAKNNGIKVMVEIMLGMPGETIETIYECIDKTLALDVTVVGYILGVRVFPYSPLGIKLAEESNGNNIIRGLQSNNAISPIILKTLKQCKTAVEYERQFMFDEFGQLRPLCYFSPELPENEDVIENPGGRWVNTIRLIWNHVPEQERYRVMLPTEPGITIDDNNIADNPFTTNLVKQGYKGAYWAKWRERINIMNNIKGGADGG